MKRLFIIALLGLLAVLEAPAADYVCDGLLLSLNEKTGRFTLFISSDDEENKWQPLFFDKDPRTSFLSVLVNDRAYKLGDSSSFKIRMGEDIGYPSFLFDSPFLSVTEEFSFITGNGSPVANGIYVAITLRNPAENPVTAGARFLLDTFLCEESGGSLSTNLRPINSEILLTELDSDIYWNDGNGKYSLLGSLPQGPVGSPDSVHIANWKRLSDVSWKVAYQPGRNFSFPPYSTGDTAVCYYFDPLPLGPGESRRFGFSLFFSGGEADFSGHAASAPPAAPSNSKDQDLADLREIISIIDARIYSGTATEEDLAAIEFALGKLRAKYGAGPY